MKKIISILIIFIVLIFFNFFYDQYKENTNWQFYIENQTGAKSVLNFGKNLTFDENFIYLGDGVGIIHSIGQKNGQINWLQKLGDHTPFEITQDDTSIYISSFDSHIYKLDKNNGYILWSYAIESQYWPDTEVILDKNDKYVFFADRGGNLYAIDKDSGHEVWRREFQSLDNTIVFKENSIHFGFLQQNEDDLIVDHFPSKTIYKIRKDDGTIIEENESLLNIDLQQPKKLLVFDNYDLDVKQNVVDQPTLNLLDKSGNLIWAYQTRIKINSKEIYQHKNRAYFLDINNQILSSIIIANRPINDEKIIKSNFIVEESFASHGPFNVHPNPHIRFEKVISKTVEIKQKIKDASNYFKYTLNNFLSLALIQKRNIISPSLVFFIRTTFIKISLPKSKSVVNL